MTSTAYSGRLALVPAPESPYAFPTSLEEELGDILSAAGLRGRQARAVATRLGWSGGAATTLASAAENEGYSRERVRQLEGRLRRHAECSSLVLPLTATALRLVENAAPIARREIPGKLAHAGLSSGPFDLSGVLSAAELGGLPVRLCEREGIVLREGETEAAATIGSAAEGLVRRHGAASVDALTRRSSPDAAFGAARQLLEAQNGVVWLDDRREWFLVQGVRSPVASMLRKMFSVSPALTLEDVDEGLRRAFRPVSLPENVLLRLCKSTSWLTVDEERTIRTKVDLDEARFLSKLERAVVHLFREAGPELKFSTAVRLGERDNLNPNSVGLYLLRSPVFRKVSRGRYTLCGHEEDTVTTT